MSEADDVQQKKDSNEVVRWNEYEALCDTLTKRFNAVCDSLHDDVLVVDNKLNATHDIATATQETVTTIQRSIADLTQAVHTLQASFDHPPHQQPLDHEAAASVQDDNYTHDDANAAAATGRREGLLLGGHGGRGMEAEVLVFRLVVVLLLSAHVVALMMILPNQPTMMMMGWANQSSLYPSLLVLLMWKSTSIGS
jgi:hypothetical protein